MGMCAGEMEVLMGWGRAKARVRVEVGMRAGRDSTG